MKNVDLEVPFYPQKWDLSKWKEFGFKNREDAEYWEKSSCGALCLKMAVDALLLKDGKSLSPPISEYIKEGVAIGAYTDEIGWNHAGLVRLAEHFGIPAIAYKKFTTEKIQSSLARGYLCIVSIRWAFQPIKRLKERILFWRKVGGHLALVVGVREENSKLIGFYVNHTSTRIDYNWEHKLIPLEEFKRGFTGRGLVVGES